MRVGVVGVSADFEAGGRKNGGSRAGDGGFEGGGVWDGVLVNCRECLLQRIFVAEGIAH